MIKAAEVWNTYSASAHPQGQSADVYRHLKCAFYSGMISTFTAIDVIEKTPITDLDEGARLIEAMRLSIDRRDDVALKLFNEWIEMVYTSGTTEDQKKHLLESFMQGMFCSFHMVSALSGPNEEADEIGASRLVRFREDILSDMERMV